MIGLSKHSGERGTSPGDGRVVRTSTISGPPERIDQLARRAERNDLALVDDRHAVAEALGLVHVVRGQEHGAPRARKPVMMSQSWRRDCGSRPVVGSSRNSSSGSPTSRTRRRAAASGRPKDSRSRRPASRAARPDSSTSSTVRPRLEERRNSGSTSRTLSRSGRCVSCSDTPIRSRSARSSLSQRRPALDVAGGGISSALRDLHRRGLAGAVRTEQAEAFAALRCAGRDRPPR